MMFTGFTNRLGIFIKIYNFLFVYYIRILCRFNEEAFAVFLLKIVLEFREIFILFC